MIGRLVLRLFGIRDEKPVVPVYKCPTCGHERPLPMAQDPVDAYLSGASLAYLENAIDWRLRHEP